MKRPVLAFVFLIGMVAGGLLDQLILRFVLSHLPTPPVIEGRLTSDLSLDDEQRVKVHKILLDADAAIRGLHEKTRADFDAEIARAQEQIGALLRPDQKKKYEVLLVKWESHRKGGFPKTIFIP